MMITVRNHQILLPLYESDSNLQPDCPKAGTEEDWWQNQEESSKSSAPFVKHLVRTVAQLEHNSL